MDIHKRCIPERSADTQALILLLGELKPGEVLAYDTMSKAIGRNVRSQPGQARLASARRVLLHEEGMVLESVRGEGIKRCDDVGIVKVGETGVARIHRASRRVAQKLTAVKDFASLPNDLKHKHNAALSIAGVLSMMTRAPSMKRIAKVAEQEHARAALPIGRTLELFMHDEPKDHEKEDE